MTEPTTPQRRHDSLVTPQSIWDGTVRVAGGGRLADGEAGQSGLDRGSAKQAAGDVREDFSLLSDSLCCRRTFVD